MIKVGDELKLHRGQIEAIDSFLSIVERPEKSSIIGPWEGPELDKLSKQFLQAPPWKDLINYGDFLWIVFRELGTATKDLPEDYVGPVCKAEQGEKILLDAKKALIDFLESLPRPYFVYFPLVGLPPLQRPVVELADSIAIVDTSSDKLDSRLVGSSAGILARAFDVESLKLQQNRRYLRLQTIGYASTSPLSSAAASVVARLKHFLFAGIASGCFQEPLQWQREKNRESPFSPSPVALIRHIDEGLDESHVLDLPEEFMRYLLSMTVNTAGLEVYDMTCGTTVLGGELRAPISSKEIADALVGKLTGLTKFLSIPIENEDAIRIKAAIEWWIDGSASENQTISFLQLCIGFEALMGEEGGDNGMTERLADRYSYLLGKTISERKRLREQFRTIYRRRSEIVHQREVNLRRDDELARSQAKVMLQMAIQTETRQLLTSIKGRSSS